jgi:hypothetical protein
MRTSTGTESNFSKAMDCEPELLATSHISVESQALSMAIQHRLTNKRISEL